MVQVVVMGDGVRRGASPSVLASRNPTPGAVDAMRLVAFTSARGYHKVGGAAAPVHSVSRSPNTLLNAYL